MQYTVLNLFFFTHLVISSMFKASIIRLNALYLLSLKRALVILCIPSRSFYPTTLVHSKTNCNSIESITQKELLVKRVTA